MTLSSEKKGYLKEDFKFFYIKSKENDSYEYHFHDFHKIVILISGNTSYLVEGRAFKLDPWDILFISNNEIHRPKINDEIFYERFVIWISPEYLKSISTTNSDLSVCFDSSRNNYSNILRLKSNFPHIQSLLYEMHSEMNSDLYGKSQILESLFIKLMVLLSRETIEDSCDTESASINNDDMISKLIKYINDNISENISIDSISKDFYLSRYYLMHKFKEVTGFTINNYITQKRLMMACGMLRNGCKPSEVYSSCGFNDYSNFYRSFKKFFGMSPKDYKISSLFRD